MKFGPKEIKELNEYLRTGRNRKREFLGGDVTFASDMARPEPKREVVEIDAINAFMKRNPRADGGRIGFDSGGDVEKRTKKITKAVNRYNKLLTDGLAKKDISKIPSFQGWFTKNYPDIPPRS